MALTIALLPALSLFASRAAPSLEKCVLLLSDLVGTLARVIAPVRMPVLGKAKANKPMPARVLLNRKFVVSKIRLTIVRSVDQVPLLPPAADLDRATVATPALPLAGTVSDDDYVLADNSICATSGDIALAAIPCPVIWEINVFESEIPNARHDPDFDKYFASCGFVCVQQLKEIDDYEPDADDMYFDGIDGIDPVMSMFEPHVPDSAPPHYDDMGALDYQVKDIRRSLGNALP
jgi:hypothetical protein